MMLLMVATVAVAGIYASIQLHRYLKWTEMRFRRLEGSRDAGCDHE
jgi:hypothetical protein